MCYKVRCLVKIQRTKVSLTPSWTALLCLYKPDCRLDSWSHCSHLYFTPSWTLSMCFCSCLVLGPLYKHWLQWYLTPPWAYSVCCLTLKLCAAVWSHWLQWNLVPIFLDKSCFFNRFYCVTFFILSQNHTMNFPLKQLLGYGLKFH